MAVLRHSVSRNSYNLVLNLFIAVVVVATFLMLCYMVYVPSNGYRRETQVRLEHRYQENAVGRSDDSAPGRTWEGKEGERVRKQPSHFDSLHEDIKKMILERIPDFNRSRLQLHGRPALPQPIHYLSTHFNTRNCKLPHCSEFLDEDNLLRWKQCSWEATANGSMSASNMSGPTDDSSKDSCQFAEHQDRKPVALMSLPGSGNTWVRGLLETATGICTGAVYCDVSLRGTFIGEHVTSGRALVVKTHIDAPPRKSKRNGMFGSAIVLVRNPFKALVAEWNRKVSNGFRERTTVLDSHVSAAGPEWFGRNERWGEYVESQMERWARVIRQWVLSDLIPVLVVQYETLQEDTTHQVRRMLNFLHVEHSQRELEERLGKKFEQYHRNHHPHQFQHFTDEQRVWINSMIKDVSSLLSFSDKSHLLDVDRYILE